MQSPFLRTTDMIPVLKRTTIVTSSSLKNNKHLQFWTKYLELSKEIKPNWRGLGSFEICFYGIFDCFYQKLISRRETDH